jgi:hypothetical protein
VNPILNPSSGGAPDASCPKLLYWKHGAKRIHRAAQRRILRGRHACLPRLDRLSFKAGDSPETIRQNFSSLSLEQVYGAIAFYLAHEQEVDTNVREGEEEIQRSVPHLSESRPELYARLEGARRDIGTRDLAKH